MKFRISLVVLSCIISVVTGLLLSQRGILLGGQNIQEDVSGRKAPLIGLSLDTLKAERWQRDRDLFVSKVKNLGGEVLVQSANSDDAQQIQDVQALISRGVDVLVIAPHDGAAMAQGVRQAKEAGIPVIAYDRLITDCDLDLYMTFDNVRVGELQAQFLVDQFLPKGIRPRIIRVYGAKTDHNVTLFKQGQDNVLKPLIAEGKVTVIHEDWAADWKPENAKKIVNAAITQNGKNFDAVLACNDGTAGGAIQALIEEGMAGKAVVVGQDAELTACQRIVNGTQSMTIYKPLNQLANQAAAIAMKMARREIVIAPNEIYNGYKEVPSIFLDVYVVTQNNMRETVIRDGLHSEELVYRKSS